MLVGEGWGWGGERRGEAPCKAHCKHLKATDKSFCKMAERQPGSLHHIPNHILAHCLGFSVTISEKVHILV